MTENDSGFSFQDKRRVDPETGELRDPVPGDPAADSAAASAPEGLSGDPKGEDPQATSEASVAAEAPADGEAESDDLGVEIPDDASALDGEAVNDPNAALAAERLGDLQRVNAEYASYRRRADRDRDIARDQGVASVVDALIPVLDEVALAKENGDLTGPFETHAAKLFAALAKAGVEQYAEPGEEFDPHLHEALMQQPSSEVQVATISMVMQPGYRLGERVLRAARVGVFQPED